MWYADPPKSTKAWNSVIQVGEGQRIHVAGLSPMLLFISRPSSTWRHQGFCLHCLVSYTPRRGTPSRCDHFPSRMPSLYHTHNLIYMKCLFVIHDTCLFGMDYMSINYNMYSFVGLGSRICTKTVNSDGTTWYVYLLYVFKPQLWGGTSASSTESCCDPNWVRSKTHNWR